MGDSGREKDYLAKHIRYKLFGQLSQKIDFTFVLEVERSCQLLYSLAYIIAQRGRYRMVTEQVYLALELHIMLIHL
jgi:hypothetical protein